MRSVSLRFAAAGLLLLLITGCGLGASGVGGTCDFKAGDCMKGLICYSANAGARSPASCGTVCNNNADCGGLDCTCTNLGQTHFFDGAPVQQVCVLVPSNLACR